jgi:hypothetical protein
MSKPWWIDHTDQVVRNESAAVAGLSGAVPQLVLKQRQRAQEAGELDEGAVDHRRHVYPGNPGPPPGQKNATHNEADEQQMDGHYKISASSVPHLVTYRYTYPGPQ